MVRSMLTRRIALALGALSLLVLPAPAALAAPSAQDAAYLRAAHQTNLAEITGGRIAEQKSTTPAVRDLAARLIADHTRMDVAVRDAAAALAVDLPAAPTPEQQALADRYRAAAPAGFDRLYLATQLDGHAKSLARTQAEIANGSDPRAKQVAAAAAPVIEAHHRLVLTALGYSGHGGRE